MCKINAKTELVSKMDNILFAMREFIDFTTPVPADANGLCREVNLNINLQMEQVMLAILPIANYTDLLRKKNNIPLSAKLVDQSAKIIQKTQAMEMNADADSRRN